MSNNIKNLSAGVNPSVEIQSLRDIANKTDNLYKSINIISNRAKQISVRLKEELHGKLEEFASSTDNLEEVFENREQIEISKFYERMPHPTILATQEFMEDKIYFRLMEDSETEE